ncbi:polysaccharide pyruvyl transferase family protein [Rhodococcus pyridinivorans]|uniref:polysaccharide pyruvyl transferase family protein n=1 Tax=Rhodococcus pyridinivorans TaxID=103816 RepID=UPI00280ABC36|nr:polysaccharide pyruvyl transferase family protein [Rhodococcus pyridinivorans]WMM71978.1 polysaccharide pyruvyl transferase family protein [Rhodococcus pyridinivorans]
MSYIDAMKSIATDRYAEVYKGVSQLIFTDFPDYPNVGDSAIALGQLNYFKEQGISVKSAYCIATLPENIFESRVPVMINGGGNIAGLFDGIDDHRNRLAQELHDDTLLIQAPQSVHFASAKGRSRFINEFASRPNLRMAVRDRAALDEIAGIISDPILAPDAVHHLGHIPSDPPTFKYVVLARRDQESGASDVPVESFDWKKDDRRLAVTSSIRWKSLRIPALAKYVNKSVAQWEEIAESRLQRGVNLLSQGETVVTDRLHAMLISLQMGRQVVAIDNNNRKLTKYADTWFGNTQPAIQFASSFSEAIKIAG